MNIEMGTDKDRMVIEEMKWRIVRLQAFVIDLYNLNKDGMKKYRELMLEAIEELADEGYLPICGRNAVFLGEDDHGYVRTVCVEGPIRELVDIIKDEVMGVGESRGRNERFLSAMRVEYEPLLMVLTSYACYELVNDTLDALIK